MKKNIILIVFILIISLVFISCEGNASENQEIVSSNETVNETVANETTNNEAVNNETVTDNNATDNVASSTDENVLELGKTVPDFEMVTLSGDTIKISDYKGKIVLLNFWATWCKYCDIEMPDLNTINQEDDVVVLTINVRETKKIVGEYINEGGYTFEVVLDENGELADTFFINAFPTTFFISEEGTLLGSVPGMLEMDRLKEILDDIRNGVIQ